MSRYFMSAVAAPISGETPGATLYYCCGGAQGRELGQQGIGARLQAAGRAGLGQGDVQVGGREAGAVGEGCTRLICGNAAAHGEVIGGAYAAATGCISSIQRHAGGRLPVRRGRLGGLVGVD